MHSMVLSFQSICSKKEPTNLEIHQYFSSPMVMRTLASQEKVQFRVLRILKTFNQLISQFTPWDLDNTTRSIVK